MQQPAESRTEPERSQAVGLWIFDPDHLGLQREGIRQTGVRIDSIRQFSVASKKAVTIQEKRTIRQTLPRTWPEVALRDQMVRLIVQAAIEERPR